MEMTVFSSKERKKTLAALAEETLDLLIIGGGITGAGIALDAAQRSMRTGLVEMQDFAAGTSSRSTKLVHGGLRYLAQFEVKLVADVGKERAIVYENGPHVTTPEWMLLPFYQGGTFGPFSTSIGLRVYDFLAGVKKSERRKMLSAEEALRREPLLSSEGLKGAGYYVEYKTDDARLTLEVLKKSVALGAKAANYAKVVEFIYDEAKVIGVILEDQTDGERYTVYARKIINATGPWVDNLRELDKSKEGQSLHLTKGVHLIFSQEKFPLQQAIYFDTEDKRMVFAIPRDGKTYVGTTDTFYEGDIAHPTVTEEDRDYILNAANFMFPTLGLTKDDVDSSYAGLRPLISQNGKNPGEISRKDEIFISKSGLYSIAGGKLTGYRKMAEEIVDAIVNELKEEAGILFDASNTKELALSGGDVGGSAGFKTFKKQKVTEGIAIGLREEEAEKLVQTYGSNVDKVFAFYEAHKAEAKEKAIDPVTLATLLYAIDYEAAVTPVDYFNRRTSAILFNYDAVIEEKDQVIDYMAQLLQWSDARKERYSEELNKALEEAR